MLPLKRVLEKQKQRCIQKSVLEDWFVGLWPIRILQAYGPKFRQLKKSITIYITHDYQASDENELWCRHSMII